MASKHYVIQRNGNQHIIMHPGGVVVATSLIDYEAQRICDLLNWWQEALLRQPWGDRYTSRDIQRAMEESLCNMTDRSPTKSKVSPPPLLTLPSRSAAPAPKLSVPPTLPAPPALPGSGSARPMPAPALPPPLLVRK